MNYKNFILMIFLTIFAHNIYSMQRLSVISKKAPTYIRTLSTSGKFKPTYLRRAYSNVPTQEPSIYKTFRESINERALEKMRQQHETAQEKLARITKENQEKSALDTLIFKEKRKAEQQISTENFLKENVEREKKGKSLLSFNEYLQQKRKELENVENNIKFKVFSSTKTPSEYLVDQIEQEKSAGKQVQLWIEELQKKESSEPFLSTNILFATGILAGAGLTGYSLYRTYQRKKLSKKQEKILIQEVEKAKEEVEKPLETADTKVVETALDNIAATSPIPPIEESKSEQKQLTKEEIEAIKTSGELEKYGESEKTELEKSIELQQAMRDGGELNLEKIALDLAGISLDQTASLVIPIIEKKSWTQWAKTKLTLQNARLIGLSLRNYLGNIIARGYNTIANLLYILDDLFRIDPEQKKWWFEDNQFIPTQLAEFLKQGKSPAEWHAYKKEQKSAQILTKPTSAGFRPGISDIYRRTERYKQKYPQKTTKGPKPKFNPQQLGTLY